MTTVKEYLTKFAELLPSDVTITNIKNINLLDKFYFNYNMINELLTEIKKWMGIRTEILSIVPEDRDKF